MSWSIFCSIDEPLVVAGGSLSGTVVLIHNEGLGSSSDAGATNTTKVFLDTMFTLEETLVHRESVEESSCFKFRFSLPKNLPASMSFVDLPSTNGTSCNSFWIDSASGVNYSLIASIDPLTQDLLRSMELEKLSSSKSTGASMDHFTILPIEISQTENEQTRSQSSLRLRVDPFLEDSMLHRGPLVESTTKKIPGDSFFSESRPVTLSVNIDQYVTIIGNAFPILVSVENSSNRAVEKLEPRLISTTTVTRGDRKLIKEYIACTGREMDLSVSPGSTQEDVMYWFKIPLDLRIPSSYHTSLFKVSYELKIKAILAGGHSIEVNVPVFLVRGAQLLQKASPSIFRTVVPLEERSVEKSLQPS